jgi:diguanylate cyclase (GGDEF)-like protein
MARIQRSLAARPLTENGEAIRTTFSCGIAERCAEESLERLVERADLAMYQAKRAGKNRCVFAQ